jgi:hypothetical protein
LGARVEKSLAVSISRTLVRREDRAMAQRPASHPEETRRCDS